MTLGDLTRAYLAQRRLDFVAGELSPPTYKDYLKEVQAFLAAVGMNAEVTSLKPEHFARYNELLVTQRKLGRHARKRAIAAVKAMLNWGAGRGYFPPPAYGNGFEAPDTRPDAMRKAKARAGKKDFSRRIVTGEEVTKMVNATNPQFRAIILLGVNCGLGPADIGRLRWRHIDMATGKLDMPRGKTGTERHGYLWKKTRKALDRVATLKHNKAALGREGNDALIFWTRKRLPMYRETEILEDGVSVGVKVDQAISITITRLAKRLDLEGVSHYRLRHTFKTLGKKARDKDALNLMMGHKENTIGETYDHEEIEFRRIKKVSRRVFRILWPKKSDPR